MGNLKARMAQIKSGQPGTEFTRIGNDSVRDNNGRVFRIKSLEQIEAQRNHKRAEAQNFEGRKHNFVFSDMDNIDYAIESLTTAQCGYLLVLSCFTSYDGLLTIGKTPRPMTTDDMMRELNLKQRKQRTFYDFLEACQNFGIIYEDSRGYNMNPKLHFKGDVKGKNVIRSYISKVKEVYRDVSAAELGLVYRMLQYVHLGTNVLASNPYEPIPELVRPLNRKDLADKLGVTPQYISKKLPKIVFGNEYVVATETIGKVTSYKLNPWVFWRGKGVPDDSLRFTFRVKAK